MKFFLFLSCLATAYAAEWAVIVAGSKSYGNYRHQADACHAYHVVSKFGIPDSRIIVFMYDDIANSKSNPYPGKMFNKPTAQGVPGIDVYEGCKKDYTGAQVTPANFVKVLTGDTSAPGPVLKSKSGDNVFVNFVDHGGTNLIAFPSGTMSSTMLNNALKTMHSKNMYSKLVFYLEACESGSMFEGKLPTDMNIYATTASNAKESSWGTYCPPDDKVNGVELKSCLGDLYSVNWMENADKIGPNETLKEQFDIVVKTTSKSHVMAYGDLSWNSDQIGEFMGDTSNTVKDTPKRESVNVDSRDIPVHLAYYNYIRADKSDFEGRRALRQSLIQEINDRENSDMLFMKLAKSIGGESLFFNPATTTSEECLCCDKVHQAMADSCGGYTDYSLQYSRVVVNLCEVSSSTAIIKKLTELC